MSSWCCTMSSSIATVVVEKWSSGQISTEKLLEYQTAVEERKKTEKRKEIDSADFVEQGSDVMLGR